MGSRFKPSPAQLVLCTLAGGLLGGLPFTLDIFPDRSFHGMALFAWIALGFGVMIGGFYLAYWSSEELKQGILNEHWPMASVDRLRSFIDSPASTALHLALALGMIVILVFSWHHWKRFYWPLFLMVQSISMLRKAFKPPTPRSTGPRIDFRNIPPIQSDHWGQPRI